MCYHVFKYTSFSAFNFHDIVVTSHLLSLDIQVQTQLMHNNVSVSLLISQLFDITSLFSLFLVCVSVILVDQ